MAIVVFPPELRIRSIQWTLERPAQVNRSAYTGSRKVATDPWHALWRARAELVPIVGDAAKARSLRAFVASLRGAVNTVRLPATEGGQKGLTAATVQTTAAQGASAMTVAGCYLLPGHMITVNDQLLQVVTSAPSGSNCAITFEGSLRAAANAGTVIETGNPTCLVALTGSAAGWAVDPGQLYSSSFEFEEAF